jgi:hypothetical protein
MNTTQVMVPGILVALKSSVNGGVEYQRTATEEDADGRVKKWETTRFMEDPAERKAAGVVAGEASRLVARLCVRTTFGLLCRTDREAELDAAVREMREKVSAWNRKATHSFVNVSAIKGRIADNDEEAIRAILDEARDLLDQMDRGMSASDVEVIRSAAMRAKRLSEMMTDESSEQINAALDAARQAARAIVKRGDDLGDRVANVTIEIDREAFDEARFSFLDATSTVVGDLPSIDVGRAAALEVDEVAAS